jgi:hypothetical protein
MVAWATMSGIMLGIRCRKQIETAEAPWTSSAAT